MIKCELCNREFNTYNTLGHHIKSTHKITTKEYYDTYLKQHGEGICPICGKETPFLYLSKGYQHHCSRKCSSKDPVKIAQNNLKRYGYYSKPVEIYENGIKCGLCDKNFKNYKSLGLHIVNKHKITTKEYYDLFMKKENEGICPICGKDTSFITLTKGYHKYCSKKCLADSNETKIKIKQTKLERYGDEHYTNREKAQQTNLEKYGVKCNFERPDVREKAIKNNHTKEIKEKIKKTKFERYGKKNTTHIKKIPKQQIRKCEICNKECNDFIGLSSHISKAHHMKPQEYYDKYLKTDKNEGICPVCGKETPFLRLAKGYQKHCSFKCARIDKETRERCKQTKLERYGDEYYSNREKARQTNLEKYGVESPFQSSEIQQKIRVSNLEKYGVENLLQLDEVKEKAKQTNLKKYGVEYPRQSEDVKEKIIKTNQVKYGYDYTLQCPKVIEKGKQTKLEKYGDENFNNREQMKQTNLKRYGNENYNNREQAIKTNLEKYGVEYPNQSREIRLKAIKTLHKNGNGSSYETYLEIALKELQINYEKQYKDSRYPYFCDFYLPDTDTFIEINGTWMHNKYWFDENSEQDKKKLELWIKKSKEGHKQYTYAINIWTVSDIEKRDCAIKNNLNYVVLWNKQDIEEFVNKLSQEKGSDI